MRIYTRTGDAGETGLFGGERVGKDCLRVEAYGTLDELNSVLGIARAELSDGELRALVARLQNELFALGSDLATPYDAGETHGRAMVRRVTPEQTAALELEIDKLTDTTPPLNRFILPGGAPSAAWLHMARTVCRRAERLCVALSRAERVNPEALRYINRLSDLMFAMARTANHIEGVDDIPWESAETY